MSSIRLPHGLDIRMYTRLAMLPIEYSYKLFPNSFKDQSSTMEAKVIVPDHRIIIENR